MEKWASIEGYNGYEVSNIGRVRALDRIIENPTVKGGTIRKQKIKGRILKPHKSNKGYMIIDLSNNTVRKKFTIHRLVGMAFIPNKENKPCINHKNEVKDDNRVENLEWVTYLENNKYNDKHKRCARFFEKSIYRINEATGEKKKYKSAKEAKDLDGFNATRIARCCKGKEKRHRGYLWQYANND